MKAMKVTVLVLVLLAAMAVPAFANTTDDTPADRIEIEYRTELHQKTDEFLFSNDVQNRLAEEGIKVVYTAPIDDSTVEVGVTPEKEAAMDTVLNLLIANDIGSEENFEVIYSAEVTIMPFTTDEPAEDAPDVEDMDEEDYVRPDDENAEVGITATDDMDDEDYVRPDDEDAEVGIISIGEPEEEEEGNGFIIPIVAILGLAGAAGGFFYFKR